MTTSTQTRITLGKVARESYRALSALDDTVDFDPALRELVKLRASQINGCAFCVDMHSRDALAGGEDERRVWAVAVWREAPFFDERERAALALTEAMTRLPDAGVPDDVYDEAARHFDEHELGQLMFAIITINAWNRVARAHAPAAARLMAQAGPRPQACTTRGSASTLSGVGGERVELVDHRLDRLAPRQAGGGDRVDRVLERQRRHQLDVRVAARGLDDPDVDAAHAGARHDARQLGPERRVAAVRPHGRREQLPEAPVRAVLRVAERAAEVDVLHHHEPAGPGRRDEPLHRGGRVGQVGQQEARVDDVEARPRRRAR